MNYTVTYAELPAGDSRKEIVIAPRTNATLTGLKKFTKNYSITVFASTAKGGGGGTRVSLLLSLQMKTVRTVSSGITQSVVAYSFGISMV